MFCTDICLNGWENSILHFYLQCKWTFLCLFFFNSGHTIANKCDNILISKTKFPKDACQMFSNSHMSNDMVSLTQSNHDYCPHSNCGIVFFNLIFFNKAIQPFCTFLCFCCLKIRVVSIWRWGTEYYDWWFLDVSVITHWESNHISQKGKIFPHDGDIWPWSSSSRVKTTP